MYDVIVLGATFAAAGVVSVYGEKCLILERSLRAGSEFFGALQFGSYGEKAPESQSALSLQKELFRKGEPRYGKDALIYSFLKEGICLFASETVSIKEKDGIFHCKIHGAEGFLTFEAKGVVDTRANAKMSASKTYNLLIESEEIPNFDGVLWEKADDGSRYILRIPVGLDCSFQDAREKALMTIQKFSSTQKLILSADEFDFQVQEGFPKKENGILLLPSKAYQNPALAFDAGRKLGKEMKK